MFGKKKEKPETHVQTPTPDLELPKAELEPTAEQIVNETPKPVQKEQPQEDWIRIVGGELIKEGLYRYIVLTNHSLGEIGEVFNE